MFAVHSSDTEKDTHRLVRASGFYGRGNDAHQRGRVQESRGDQLRGTKSARFGQVAVPWSAWTLTTDKSGRLARKIKLVEERRRRTENGVTCRGRTRGRATQSREERGGTRARVYKLVECSRCTTAPKPPRTTAGLLSLLLLAVLRETPPRRQPSLRAPPLLPQDCERWVDRKMGGKVVRCMIGRLLDRWLVVKGRKGRFSFCLYSSTTSFPSREVGAFWIDGRERER